MKIKNLWYFLDPTTEQNDPTFRSGTLKSIILPQAKKLIENNDVNIFIFISDSIYNQFKDIIYESEKNINFISMNSSLFDTISNLQIRLAKNEIYKNEIVKINKYLSSIVSNLEKPDMIINYECSYNWFKDIYPDVIALYETFGAFSRPPFTCFEFFNPCEPLKGSFHNVYKKELKRERLSEDEKSVLRGARRQSMKALAELTPFKKFLSNLYDEYDAVCVLACQIDNYFAFNACCNFDTHEELLEFVLSHIPKNIALIVTEHTYSRQISENKRSELSKKYHNFKYIADDIPSPTQFLVPYIDGVISVSSSLAYQAAFWQKPYLSIGESHVDIFKTANDFREFIQQVLNHQYIDQDAVLYHLLAAVHFSHKFELFNGMALFKRLNHIRNYYLKHKKIDYNLFSRKSVEEMRKIFSQDNRLGLLRKELKDKNIESQTDHLRVAMSSGVDAISFDLFDTLVERDFIEPWELFSFIEPKIRSILKNKNFQFCKFRRQAEADVRRLTRGEFEITLDEIYEELQRITNIDKDSISKIKEVEIESEFQLVHLKRRMYREYEFSKLLTKKVAIITDMYLEENIIEKLLKRVGISNYDILLSSATTRTRKHNGTIFNNYLEILKEFSISSSSCLHIGDNSIADGDMPRKYGIRAYTLPKAIDNFYRSKIGHHMSGAFNVKGISTSIICGILANKFYGESWNKIEKDSLFNNSNYRYGYSAIGPLVLGFVQWLYRRSRSNKIDHLYFLARDGYILKEAFDILYAADQHAPNTDYLLSSRRAVIVPSISCENDIYEVASLSFNARTLSSFLENRFGIDIKKIDKKILKKYNYKDSTIVSPDYKFYKLISFLLDIKELIFKQAKIERLSYIAYLEEKKLIQHLKNGKEKSLALVDIGYSGTMQYYLSKILNSDMNGFYFLTHNFARNYYDNSIFEGYLASLDDHKTAYRHKLNDFVFIFESAFSSLDGSLLYMDNSSGSNYPVFIESENEENRKVSLERIHDGVISFIKDIKNRFGNYIFEFELSSIISSRILLSFAEHPGQDDAKLFLDIEVENLFGGGSTKLINYDKDILCIDDLIRTSCWKPGAKAFYLSKLDIKKDSRKPTKDLIHAAEKETDLLSSNKVSSNQNDRYLAKKNKLLKNPYLFFSDSRKPIFKSMRYLFNPTNRLGKLNTFLLRKIIR